ncbi:MAG: hypothetical protein IKF38_06430 [Clostridia bacterium]|nr:hypothetical protein [Clostridia bacterium]
MTRDELEEQIRSVLSKKLSQEQMTRGKISEEILAIIADRIVSAMGPELEKYISEVEIEMTSNPDEFAEKVIESKIEYGYYGDRSGYHKDDGTSSSFTTPVYGDIEPGNYHYDYVVYSDSSSEENEEKNLPDFSMNGLQVAIVDRIDDYASETAIQIYIPEEREYEVVSYKEMKEIAEKEKRTPFAKLVNQLMLKMEASLIVEGSEGYRNLTDFGRRITSEIIGIDEYFSNAEEFDKTEINEKKCVTIGMLKGEYWEEQSEEDYLDIEFLENGKVRLMVRTVDYDESRDDGDIEEEHYIASTVVSMEELQNFSDSLPGLYPKLPERMMAEGKFFDDNGRFSEDEVRDFLKQKYVPGQFFDVSVGDGSENYGQIHLSIPNGMVTDLTGDMFEKYKENLVEVFIPFSVKSVDKDTFSNCPKLKKVVMFNLPREQNPFDLFENCPNLDSILIVPEEAVQYYKQGDDIHGDLPIGSVYESNENGEGHTSFYVMDDNFERKCKLIEIRRSGHDILEVAEAVSDRRTEDINGIVSEILEAMQDKEKDDTSVQEV